MKRTSLFIGFLFYLLAFSQAQNSAFLDIGNVKATINSDGGLFYDTISNNVSFEVPKGSGTHTMSYSGFWMSGVAGGIRAASSAREWKFLSEGPVDIVNQIADTTGQFQRLWKIEKTEIDRHINNWNTPNYTLPASISDWPGNGNANTSKVLAPFKDLDGDSLYEPQNGEYPIIKGDQAIFLMLNDYRIDTSTTLDSNGNWVKYSTPMKVELHAMLYAFDTTIESISNTIFVNVRIFNRSNSSMDDIQYFRASIIADFDLGNPFDDYIGSDTVHQLFYGYNGDLDDEHSRWANSYGKMLAAQGIQFLDYRLQHTNYYIFQSPSNVGYYPPGSIFSYQRGLSQFGRKMYYSGDGFFNCIDTTKETSIVFDGNPSLVNDTMQWTEANVCIIDSNYSNEPGNRNMIGGPALPHVLKHGGSIEFNYAYVFARTDDTSNHFSDPVAKLFLVADTVQQFFDSIQKTSIQESKISIIDFDLYPNPTKSNIFLKIKEDNFKAIVFNLQGVQLFQAMNQRELSLKGIAAGVYFVRIETPKGFGIKKLIVSR